MAVPSRANRRFWAAEAGRALRLTASERAVLDYLAFRAGDKGKVWGRNHKGLAEDIEKRYRQISPRSVGSALKVLAGHDLLTINRQGQTASEYLLHFDVVPSPAPPKSRVAKIASLDEPVQSGSEPVQSGNFFHPDWQLLPPRLATLDTNGDYNRKGTEKELPQKLTPPRRDKRELVSGPRDESKKIDPTKTETNFAVPFGAALVSEDIPGENGPYEFDDQLDRVVVEIVEAAKGIPLTKELITAWAGHSLGRKVWGVHLSLDRLTDAGVIIKRQAKRRRFYLDSTNACTSEVA